MTLKELRHQSGKTTAEVAAALGVNIPALYHYENGRRQIGLEQVLILSRLYDESAEGIIKAQFESVVRKSN